MGAPFSPRSGHPRSFCKNKISNEFLNLIQYFYSILNFLKLILDIKYLKICLFEGDMIFQSTTYYTCWILDIWLAWVLKKLFLSTIQPWIHFLCDIDTLKYVCDFFYDFIWSFIIFFKNSFMHISFSYLI